MNQQLTPHRGVLILVFGILSWLACPFFGVAAWVMGNTDMGAIDAGTMDPEGRSLTQAGKVIGMISVILSILGLIIGIGMMVLGVSFAAIAGN